jgi:hypothetical protein
MTNDEDLEYVAWIDKAMANYEPIIYCHDCESTEDLEFVSWIDNYLCPECLKAELG